MKKLRTGSLIVTGMLFAALAGVSAPLTLPLPPETVQFKPGKGAEIAGAQCVLCHSADYVSIQPALPRAFWQANVQKMREKYGAPLPEPLVAPLVDYLTKTYGKEK
ncbi:MAG: cytochrome c [Verrucomicrobia bacterium]|nr:cytochrome c [Verrucomicrobiota bacterium]